MAGAVCAGAGERLLARLPEGAIFRLSHVGSTAIDGIWAKPTVDMVLEAADAAAFKRLDAAIPTCGYIRMRSEEGRVSFNRGYTPKGFAQEVFHLHLRLPGDADEVFFRDYLNLRPDLAAEYERLKLCAVEALRTRPRRLYRRQGRLRAARDGGGETVFRDPKYDRRSFIAAPVIVLR